MKHTHMYNFKQLGPGRPSAGGPRMDCRVVTSLGVVNVSRLASPGGKATSPSIGEEVTFFVTEIDTLHHYIYVYI